MLHITTERLVLKPHTPNCLAWLNTTFNDPDEDYFIGDDPPKERPETLEETQKVLDRILNRPSDAGMIDFAIYKKEASDHRVLFLHHFQGKMRSKSPFFLSNGAF